MLTSLGYLALIPLARLKAHWLGASAIILLLIASPRSTQALGLIGKKKPLIVKNPSTTVSVAADSDEHRTLQANHRFQMSSTRAIVAERRQTLLPLFLHHNPKKPSVSKLAPVALWVALKIIGPYQMSVASTPSNTSSKAALPAMTPLISTVATTRETRVIGSSSLIAPPQTSPDINHSDPIQSDSTAHSGS
ncbi:MAG: hypothetical protein M2R45_04660 [Verrucomicrobia subdivision 3 bacterium]|nr:hypothetical protein [Limisphaerales bacterium]MCS1416582.1 hypothetical protein [Limisphaerales bacterium]